MKARNAGSREAIILPDIRIDHLLFLFTLFSLILFFLILTAKVSLGRDDSVQILTMCY